VPSAIRFNALLYKKTIDEASSATLPARSISP